ncbi:N-acetylmuramoyl-L-alanine amidase [Domibacillus robiginosus]|uniref:N-acetylmuramoyl-L-alanine amidase n=1 Tax=Domibacillus robiginosus TaxID=1071054 RepID=UPI000ADF3E9B|nr:N-acetylmuramoyl-L-alanine amidase [Domibacillus robiginosus]
MKKWTMFMAALCLVLSLLGIQAPVQAAGFKDVPPRAVKEVNYLTEGKIVYGVTSTSFVPEATLTRAQVAIFVGRTLQLDGHQRETRFADIGKGNTASGYIEALADKGIMTGTPENKFFPSKAVTRSEMAVILKRAFSYSGDAEQALLKLGIASGMADGTFGSSKTITRADFAVFLARAVNPAFRLKQTASFDSPLVSTVNNLNIRTGPSTNYASIGKISGNTKVTGAHSVGGWTYIQTGALTGFVSSYYLRSSAGGAVTSPAPAPSPDNHSALAGQTIILDPGHGGKDPGAVGNGLNEKDVVLKTGLQVRNLLKQTPFTVKMTRSSDVFIELIDRSKFAKNENGDIFVSIHANAASPAATGTEAYYYAAGNQHVADSKLLGEKIQARMIDAWGLRDRGTKPGNLSVLRENSMPATLLELGFITNAEDAAKMASDAQMNKMSIAIYNGILDYYKAKGFNVSTYYK